MHKIYQVRISGYVLPPGGDHPSVASTPGSGNQTWNFTIGAENARDAIYLAMSEVGEKNFKNFEARADQTANAFVIPRV